MAPRDRLRKVSRNYFSVTDPALLLVSHKRLCVIDTNTPCLAVMALSAENLLTSIMHSCIPIPESFPSLPLPLLDYKHVEKRTHDLSFFFSMHRSQRGVKIKTNYKTEFSESQTIKEKYISPQQEMVISSI